MPTTPDMPSGYADAADGKILDNPDMTIAEAYWHAACELLGITKPLAATSIRRTRTVGGWIIRWREDDKQKQRSFKDPYEARQYQEWLMRGGRETT